MFRKLTTARTTLREHKDWERAVERSQHLQESELHSWWESTLYGLQRGRESYERTRDPLALTEARSQIATLLALVDELHHRRV